MIDKEEYAQAKRLLAEIQYKLNTQPLTAEQRKGLELHAAALSGFLLYPWLPADNIRRLVMLALVALGVQQAYIGNYQPMVWWLLLPFFSPRIVGTSAYFLGRIAHILRSR